jgi:hypothetical protein
LAKGLDEFILHRVMTGRAGVLGITLVTLMLALTASSGAARREASPVCPETVASPTPPNAWMGSLATHWLRQNTLWMAYTRADRSFLATPTGQKIGWFRSTGSPWGRLRVSGSRIDGDAPPLKVQIGVSYPFREGFQSSALTFSTPGCWQIVAHVGLSARYIFVVRVESVPALPTSSTG